MIRYIAYTSNPSFDGIKEIKKRVTFPPPLGPTSAIF
jgi:hypothetical protein